MALKYNICFNEDTGGVILPCYSPQGELQWIQERGVLPDAPKYRQPRAAKRFTWNNMYWGTSRVAVVTEDVASAVRVADACDNKIAVHSLLGTSINDAQIVLLMDYEIVILWMDDDKAGHTAVRVIKPLLSKFTKVVSLRTDIEPKQLSNREIQELLCKAIT
jgi:hypothetical protein